MNECAACGQDFASVENFDRHRVGNLAYSFRAGLAFGREDGRRCLDADELREMGFTLNRYGRWCDLVEIERGKAALASAHRR